jgi:hypothetical protein
MHVTRSLPPISERVIRFLMHASLMLGCFADSSQFDFVFRGQIVNTSHVPTIEGCVGEYLRQHVRADWVSISKLIRKTPDDVNALFHLMLDTIGTSIKTTVCCVTALPLSDSFILLINSCQFIYSFVLSIFQIDYTSLQGPDCSPQKRNDFEMAMSEVVGPIFNNDKVEQRVAFACHRFKTSASDEGAVFVAQLREETSWETMALQDRAKLLPALWRYRQPYTLEDVKMMILNSNENLQKYPFLARFLRDEHKLRGLKYMASMSELSNLMTNGMAKKPIGFRFYHLCGCNCIVELLHFLRCFQSSPVEWTEPLLI